MILAHPARIALGPCHAAAARRGGIRVAPSGMRTTCLVMAMASRSRLSLALADTSTIMLHSTKERMLY